MLWAVITIYVVTLILFMPMFLVYTTRWAVDPSTNATVPVLSHRPNYPFHPDVPKHILVMLTGIIMPVAVLVVIVSSVLVLVKLAVARKTRQQMASSQSQKHSSQSDTKITQMLLSLCLLFIILTLPNATGAMLNYFVPGFDFEGCYRNTFAVFFRFVSMASCLNSSVNFIAFASLSAKFRAALTDILKCSEVISKDADISASGLSSMADSRLTNI